MNNKKPRFQFWLVCDICAKQGHKGVDCKSKTHASGEFMRNVDEYVDPYRIDRNSVEEISVFEEIKWILFKREELYLIPIDQSAVYEIAQMDRDGSKRVVYLGMTGCVRERMLDHYFGRRFSNTGIERLSNIRHHKRDAILKGYSIHYRYRVVDSRMVSTKLESTLLKKYNYPWNIDENGKDERIVI